MTEALPDETWDGWTARIGAALADLGETSWLTFSVHVDSAAAVAEAAAQARKGWRRVLARPEPPPAVPDVFVQATVHDGVLALECIGDTEFEGLTDLTHAQQATLVTLGWDRPGDEPEFEQTFPLQEAGDAADLVAASLRALGATDPSRVDVRHGP